MDLRQLKNYIDDEYKQDTQDQLALAIVERLDRIAEALERIAGCVDGDTNVFVIRDAYSPDIPCTS